VSIQCRMTAVVDCVVRLQVRSIGPTALLEEDSDEQEQRRRESPIFHADDPLEIRWEELCPCLERSFMT
jgi:hypothetical protein